MLKKGQIFTQKLRMSTPNLGEFYLGAVKLKTARTPDKSQSVVSL